MTKIGACTIIRFYFKTSLDRLEPSIRFKIYRIRQYHCANLFRAKIAQCAATSSWLWLDNNSKAVDIIIGGIKVNTMWKIVCDQQPMGYWQNNHPEKEKRRLVFRNIMISPLIKSGRMYAAIDIPIRIWFRRG